MKFDDDLLEDVEIEMQQARTMANVYSDVLTGMMDAFASITSNNLNIVMKRLTSFSIIIMVPTLIASYYGMNLEKGTTIHNAQFFMVIAGSLVLSVICIIYFIRKKWF